MKYFSTFSGIGGFELGIQYAYESYNRKLLQNKTTKNIHKDSSNIKGGQVRTTCVGYSEIDKYAIQIYEKHFNHKNYGDITKINERDLPDFDLLVGGFPCQTFSIAGNRKGFEDTRGTMFFEIARIVRKKQPRLLLLENVKGLLSHDKGHTFYTIISTLDELGYDLEWQVLNSKNHGVPQNRERLFIIGHFRGTSRPKVFPFGESYEESTRETNEQRCANTLTGRSAGGQNRRGNYIKQINNPKHSNNRIYGKDGLSPTLNTAQGGNRQPFISDVSQIGREGKPRIYRDNAPTLSARDYKEPRIVNNIRRLTPTECERLQGFPDGWTEGLSDTQRYKTLGNAVTVNVISDIISKLIA